MFRNLRINRDRCLYCGNDKIYKYFLCNDCFCNLNEINKGNYDFRYLDELYISYSYSSLLKELLRGYKFNEQTYLYRVFGEMAIEIIFNNNLNRKYDLITYIATDRKRENKRGYNQAALIAEYVSENTLMKCEGLLFKKYSNKRQENLTAPERYENVKDVFYSKADLSDKNIIIIDDIVTTGYTVDFAAKALKEKGAKKVAAVITATGGNP